MTAVPAPTPPRPIPVVWAGVLVLLLAVGGLLYYKWAGSYRKVADVQLAGAWSGTADTITVGGALRTTANYFGKVWIALVFGILIGAAVRAAVSPDRVAALLAKGGAVRRQLAGGLAGAPLMLCSCCVTPIFTSVYERGARLGSALAVMLASPGLNLAAIVLTFILFPLDMSLARLGAALIAVLVLPALLERAFGSKIKPRAQDAAVVRDEGPRSLGDFALRFLRSIAYLTIVTVPLIAAGVLLSGLILPLGFSSTQAGAVAGIMIVAAIAVLIALPTFFEIPLAILLMQMGAPGAAAAMLFAGPIVNLPSLFVLGRETNAKVSASLAGGIWVLAVGAGLVVLL